MFLSIVQYLIVFAITVLLFYIFQVTYRKIYIIGFFSHKRKSSGCFTFCFLGCLSLFPVIAMYGLRYGIGTDYFSYERIYNELHYATFYKYWKLHSIDFKSYYVEPGYYVFNRLFPSYRYLLWGLGVLIFVLICLAVKDYTDRVNYGFVIFVFLSTQYIFALNCIRFTIAICFVLLAYNGLIKERNLQFVSLILAAALFHKTALLCMALFFLRNYKNKKINNIRDLFLFTSILLFPFIIRFMFRLARIIPFFERYISSYAASETITFRWVWLLHIVPVIIPLLIFERKEIFKSDDTNILFRICIMEIPFRMLGLYNTWYTRLSRYSQIAQILLIPLVLARTKDRRRKSLLYIYYIAWFIFYFAYYAIINDQADSLPYISVFNH